MEQSAPVGFPTLIFQGIKNSPFTLTGTLLSQTCSNFEEIVASCYDDVFRFALSLTGQECDAVDLTQNAFLKLVRKGGRIKEATKARSWLFSVLRNELIDLKRKSLRFPSQELDPNHQSDQPIPGTHCDGRSAIKVLASLPEPYRETLALYYLQGHTYHEISSLLDVPVGTIMSRLSRGKAQLRAIFQPPLRPPLQASKASPCHG